MSNSDNSNKVTQSSNQIEGDNVGRDKQVFHNDLVINIQPGPLNIAELIQVLVAYTGYSKDYIYSFFQPERSTTPHIQSLDQNLLLLDVLKNSSLHSSNKEIQNEYDTIVQGNKMISQDDNVRYKIRDAAACISKLEFHKAHQLLSECLQVVNSSHGWYTFIYGEYLITGFIWYSKQNDMSGLKSLLHSKSSVPNEENGRIDYLISMIFQEICSRDTNLESLGKVIETLNRIYFDSTDVSKPAMAISLGLAYRRLGERKGIEYLEKAVGIFKDGLELNNGNKIIEIELKNQMATAHIRMFEFTNDKAELYTAEKLLQNCLALLEVPMDPRDYRLKPRVLNSIGNVYKQRAVIFGEVISATKAIGYYTEAEKYWNEKDANYDWALLTKNIAETKYTLGKLTRDVTLLLNALNDCFSAIKYRNLENSPYQWGKTVKIIFSIVILLNELQCLGLVSKKSQRKIKSCIKPVIANEIKWSENLSPEFIHSAKQAQILLN